MAAETGRDRGRSVDAGNGRIDRLQFKALRLKIFFQQRITAADHHQGVREIKGHFDTTVEDVVNGPFVDTKLFGNAQHDAAVDGIGGELRSMIECLLQFL